MRSLLSTLTSTPSLKRNTYSKQILLRIITELKLINPLERKQSLHNPSSTIKIRSPRRQGNATQWWVHIDIRIVEYQVSLTFVSINKLFNTPNFLSHEELFLHCLLFLVLFLCSLLFVVRIRGFSCRGSIFFFLCGWVWSRIHIIILILSDTLLGPLIQDLVSIWDRLRLKHLPGGCLRRACRGSCHLLLLSHKVKVLVEPELLLLSLDLSSDLARTILYVVPHFSLHDYGAALLALSGLTSAKRYVLLVLIVSSDGYDELTVLALNRLHRAILLMILH